MRKLAAVVALTLSVGLTGGVLTTAAHAGTVSVSQACEQFYQQYKNMRTLSNEARATAKKYAAAGDKKRAAYYNQLANERAARAKYFLSEYERCQNK